MGYDAFYHWSIEETERFWESLVDFGGVVADSWGEQALVNPREMPGAQWFPSARLNFAENLLRRRDGAEAIVFNGEDKVVRYLTFGELYDEVSRMVRLLRDMGIQPGDRVAAFMPNIPETIVAMLAATSLGAVFSSCSPDFGVGGVLDRFGQIEPKVLFVADGYYYGGKSFDSLEKTVEIVAALPSLERVIVTPYAGSDTPLDSIPNAALWRDLVAEIQPEEIRFERLPFNHPLYIMFSSGTTGKPKCIVHGAGGTLLQHLKEHLLHCNVQPGDRLFYFTTCGWMMWNWLVSGLACEATLVLYDGNPFYPDGNRLFDLADAEQVQLFGTSAKFIDAVKKAGLKPRETHSLASVELITSTGSPLVPESFDFVYEHIKQDVHLASISGGTDIIGCFVLGNPIGPVYRGEIQTRALAMDVAVVDDEGRALIGEPGELVCRNAFPSMPVGFWNDPDGARYRAAYFEKFPGIWCHGDWVEMTERGGMVIYGRSDAVLNPGGVRIGTAEIYRQVEQLAGVKESIAIGQTFEDDVRVILFVVLQPGTTLDEPLVKTIRDRVRTECSPRHVPAKILEVADIPRTRSGKISELAVRDVVEGRPVKNTEALANPEALALFRDRSELQS